MNEVAKAHLQTILFIATIIGVIALEYKLEKLQMWSAIAGFGLLVLIFCAAIYHTVYMIFKPCPPEETRTHDEFGFLIEHPEEHY